MVDFSYSVTNIIICLTIKCSTQRSMLQCFYVFCYPCIYCFISMMKNFPKIALLFILCALWYIFRIYISTSFHCYEICLIPLWSHIHLISLLRVSVSAPHRPADCSYQSAAGRLEPPLLHNHLDKAGSACPPCLGDPACFLMSRRSCSPTAKTPKKNGSKNTYTERESVAGILGWVGGSSWVWEGQSRGWDQRWA